MDNLYKLFFLFAEVSDRDPVSLDPQNQVTRTLTVVQNKV